jgi:hypothetical protein
MFPLTIAMGTVVWAVIVYALLSPNPPVSEDADGDAPSDWRHDSPGGAARRLSCRWPHIPTGEPNFALRKRCSGRDR